MCCQKKWQRSLPFAPLNVLLLNLAHQADKGLSEMDLKDQQQPRQMSVPENGAYDAVGAMPSRSPEPEPSIAGGGITWGVSAKGV